MELRKALQWRYACKAMNGQAITDEQRNNVLEAMRLAPTSLGVQPIKFYLIRDPKVKQDLKPIFSEQRQLTECDSVVIIASKIKYDDQWLDHVTANFQKVRKLDQELAQSIKSNYKNYMTKLSDQDFAQWARRQAYICLGFGLVAAADEHIHSTPMEGFDYAALDKYLGMSETGYQPAVALVLGHSDPENDYLATQAKVRLPMSDMLIEK